MTMWKLATTIYPDCWFSGAKSKLISTDGADNRALTPAYAFNEV